MRAVPQDWVNTTIEDCCEILDRKRIPVNGVDRETRIGEVPYYGANGLQGFIDGYIFDEPLILIAEDGGRFDEYAERPIAYRISGRSWVNNHAHVLRARDNFCQDAVFYTLEHKDIQAFIVGGTRSKLNQSALKAITVELPSSKPEQTKIAEILSTVDRAIEETEALIAKQQRIKIGLMQDLLTRGIDEQGNLRSEQTHKIKDSPLGRIPVEWEVRRLGSLLESINQGWSPDCDSEPAAEGEWGILKTTSVVWEGYQGHENKGLPLLLSPRPHLEVRQGDLLMTRAGPNSRVGVVSYVYKTRSKLILSDKIYRLVPTREADGRFLSYSLSSSGSQRHLSNLKTGMAESQTNISQEIVKALLTICPPALEQSLIADHLDRVSEESRRGCSVLSKLRSLKTGLMQDLLTGRKRVTSLLDKVSISISP